MKNKYISCIAVFLMICCIFSGCRISESNDYNTQNEKINVAVLKGPTGIGMLKLMQNSEDNSAKTINSISLYNEPSEIAAKLSNNEIDIAALPTNMAASLYAKTNHSIKMLNVNTLGTLYVVSTNENINSFEKLKGNKLYMAGKGSTPEYVLQYLLEKNNISKDDVNIEYKSNHSEVLTLLLAGQIETAVLPEPFATQAVMYGENISKVLDINEEWEKISDNGSILAMGCLVARNEFIENNKEALNDFLSDYEGSVSFANSDIESTAVLADKYGIMPYDVAKLSIPSCGMVYITSDNMINKTDEFFKVLYGYDPKSIGGVLPDKEFYYEG